MPRSPFGRRSVLQRGYGLRLLILKMANNKVDLGQIRSEEIVYSRFINPFAPGDFAKKRVLKPIEWFSGHCHAIKS